MRNPDKVFEGLEVFIILDGFYIKGKVVDCIVRRLPYLLEDGTYENVWDLDSSSFIIQVDKLKGECSKNELFISD